MNQPPTNQRQLVPGPPAQDGRSPEGNGQGQSESAEKKQRVSMACAACKKSKRKCSGSPPCDNCRAGNKECIFDEALDLRRRAAAKHTAEVLTWHIHLYQDLIRALQCTNKSYALALFEKIRYDGSIMSIRAHINDVFEFAGENHQGNQYLRDFRFVLDDGLSPRPREMDMEFLCSNAPPEEVPAAPWTNVTRNKRVVSHLVSLWFTWDYPFYAILDREVFMRHMQSGDLASNCCSPFLVNALLAVASYFSTSSEAYTTQNDLITKGDDYLAEAERLRDAATSPLTVTHLQGLLLLHEKYSLCGKDDLGYQTLHLAMQTAEKMGLIGTPPATAPNASVSSDLDRSLRRAAWGLYHVDTVVHPSFLRRSLIDRVNIESPNIFGRELEWRPYPESNNPQPSFIVEYIRASCELSNIAREVSKSLFSDAQTIPSPETREKWAKGLAQWDSRLPGIFALASKPPPYVLTMRMRYFTLAILVRLYRAEDDLLGSETGMETPDSPTSSGYQAKAEAQRAIVYSARTIAKFAAHQRNNYTIPHAHHFAMYAIHLALFVLLNKRGPFNILDSDFLSLTHAFASLALRSHLGRCLFYQFRQDVRAKRQGRRLRAAPELSVDFKRLFDEEDTIPSSADDWVDGTRKLGADPRYRVRGQHRLCDMLDRYETLSLGKDEFARGRREQG